MAESKKNNDKEIERLKKELKEELLKELKRENNKNEKNSNFQDKVKDTIDNIIDTKDNTKSYDKKDIRDNKIIAGLAYIGPLCFLPYFISKESKFAMFHAKQGINLFVFEILLLVTSYYCGLLFQITKLCGSIISENFISFWINITLDFAQLFFGVISIAGLIFACQGKAKEMPVLNKIKIIK